MWRGHSSDFAILRAPNREARTAVPRARREPVPNRRRTADESQRTGVDRAGHGARRAKASWRRTNLGGTIKKRFDSIKLESTEEARRTYREMLFTAPGVADYISGVILYDETLRQKTKDGVPFSAVPDEARHRAGHQGRHGRQAARRLPERDDHRRPRRPARAARGVPQARRALREVARRHRHRRGLPDAVRASMPMRMRWRATRRCARKPASCRSSSPKC